MAHILVVDDENNIRKMVQLALQHVGHTVETAADGRAGLEEFGEGDEYDLVLLDQRMPGIEGIDVLKQMRERNPNVKIVMATAFGTIDLAVDAMKSGATDFLRKPFTAETLRGAIQSALQEPKPKKAAVSSTGVTFGSTTINGYRIEFQSDSAQHLPEAFEQPFTVRIPDGQTAVCVVSLSADVMEQVKEHSLHQPIPGADRFWQALCEEALADYLYQYAEFPPDYRLQVGELTDGLRRFIHTILAVG